MAWFSLWGKISENGILAVDKAMVLYDSLSSQGRKKTEVAGETKGEEGGTMEIKYHSILLWLCLLNPYTQHMCLFSFLKEQGVRAKLIIGLPGKPKLITVIVYWVWASQETPGVKNPPANAGDARDIISIPGSGKWQHTPVFLPRKFHGPRSLAGYSLRSHKVSDTTSTHSHTITH